MEAFSVNVTLLLVTQAFDNVIDMIPVSWCNLSVPLSLHGCISYMINY